jgi:hypothetical protein
VFKEYKNLLDSPGLDWTSLFRCASILTVESDWSRLDSALLVGTHTNLSLCVRIYQLQTIFVLHNCHRFCSVYAWSFADFFFLLSEKCHYSITKIIACELLSVLPTLYHQIGTTALRGKLLIIAEDSSKDLTDKMNICFTVFCIEQTSFVLLLLLLFFLGGGGGSRGAGATSAASATIMSPFAVYFLCFLVKLFCHSLPIISALKDLIVLEPDNIRFI